MSAPTNFVPRIRAALKRLGRNPGIGLDELVTDLEDYVTQVETGSRPTAREVVLDWPTAQQKPEPKKVRPPVRSRRKRLAATVEPVEPTAAEAQGQPTWRDFFGFSPDETVTRAALIERFRQRPMGTTRELFYRLAKSEVAP